MHRARDVMGARASGSRVCEPFGVVFCARAGTSLILARMFMASRWAGGSACVCARASIRQWTW